MELDLAHHWDMLLGRWNGPLAFRLIIQPLVAALLAARAGLKDARAEHRPHLWAIIAHPARRRELLQDTWQDVGKLFAAATLIDMIYQVIEFRWIYFSQALIVATTLAFPSYLLVRGLANRIARPWIQRGKKRAPTAVPNSNVTHPNVERNNVDGTP